MAEKKENDMVSLISYNIIAANGPYQIVAYSGSNGKSPFIEWLQELRDEKAKANIRKRLDRICEGNFGDHKCLSGGVWELRIHIGPGYRIYYGLHGKSVVLLLTAGDKSRQHHDIQRAVEFWNNYWSENNAHD